ncbi:MAG TPA: S1/P1 nuclease [Bacteroidia bacterium]|nr:S1/P1 nuclease [Bacteroidia bacterium]
MKTNLKQIILSAMLLLLCVTNSSAWNARGHMLVASIAYRSLSDSIQVYYADVLKAHPFFDKWMDEYVNISNVEFGEFLFMKAATWPDDIRNSGNPNDHPEWHYITYKVDFSNGHDKNAQNEDDNILSAMEECMETLSDASASNTAKSISLCWFIHLAGDIHQPLHCGSLFNTMFPDGDRGGNKIFVKVKSGGSAVKLHSYWDGLLGSSDNYRTAKNQAIQLIHANPATSFPAVNTLTFETWSFESFDLAVSKAYKNGSVASLDGIKSKTTAPLIPNAADYSSSAKETGEKRVSLAGYRLAKVLMNT